MLGNIDRWAVVAQFVSGMRANQGWAGETHIQKTLFFAQELLQVPCGYHFVLYKHGPYSFELHDDLGRMLTNSILGLEPRPPYGPSFRLEDIGDGIVQQRKKVVDRYSKHSEFLIDMLSGKDVKELERLGTALLLKKEFPGTDHVTLAGKIVELKSHVTNDSALEAAQEVAQMMESALGAGLITQQSPPSP